MNLLKLLMCSLFFVGFVHATEPAAPALIDLNTADEATLETLNGVGAKKAKDIIEYRQNNGGFKSVEEFGKVPGIGPKTFDANRARLTVGDTNKSPAKSETKPADQKNTTPNSTGMSGMSQPPKM